MINSIEVLIPYTSNISLKKGDKFDFERKNVLITGPNASGKSSLLHMIFESSRIYRERNKQGNVLENSRPFISFMKNLDEHSYYIQPIEEDSERLSPEGFANNVSFHSNNAVGKNGFPDPAFVSYCVLSNPNLFKDLPKLKEVVLKEIYKKFSKKIDFERDEHEFMNQDFESNFYSEAYLESLKPLSKQFGVNKEDFNKLIYMLDNQTLMDFDLPVTNYFYSVIKESKPSEILFSYSIPGENKILSGRLNLEGKVNGICFRDSGKIDFRKEILDYDKEEKISSKGEYRKNILDLFANQKEDKVLLLDEPLDGLDPNSQDEYSNKIIEQGKKENTQIFAVSHDRLFNKQVLDNGWCHLDFYKK